MTRPPHDAENWDVLLNADLDGIEALAQSAKDLANNASSTLLAARDAAVAAKNDAVAARDLAILAGGGTWTASVDPASFRGDAAGVPSASGLYVYTRFQISTFFGSLTDLKCQVKTPTTGGANGIASANLTTPPTGWAPNTPAGWTSNPAYGTTGLDILLTATNPQTTNSLQVNWTGISAADFPTQFIFSSTNTPNRTVTLTCSLVTTTTTFLSWSKTTTVVG